MTGIGADKKRGANMADMRAFTGFKLSPEYAEAKRREIHFFGTELRSHAIHLFIHIINHFYSYIFIIYYCLEQNLERVG